MSESQHYPTVLTVDSGRHHQQWRAACTCGCIEAFDVIPHDTVGAAMDDARELLLYREHGPSDKPPVVPEDVVPSVMVGTVELTLSGQGDLRSIVLRVIGGTVPLKCGERVELEVSSITRTITERS